MRKQLVLLASLLVVALDVSAATVILKGGKRLQVESYSQKGNSLVVRYTGGRVESYPLAAVDLAATGEANAVAEAAPAAKADVGPKSPFAAAMAQAGGGGLVVTDMDVAHVNTGEEAEVEGEASAPGKLGPRGRVNLVSYEKRPTEDGQWELTVSVVNNGDAPVQPVTATITALGDEGKTVGTTTATLADKLEPKQQGSLVARLVATGPITSFSFDFSWRSIVTTETRVPAPQVAQPVAEPTPTPPPPMAVANPMDAQSLTAAPPPPPQVKR